MDARPRELRITGEVKEEASGKTLRHRHGKFAYRMTLPADADSQKIDAQLADGATSPTSLPAGATPAGIVVN